MERLKQQASDAISAGAHPNTLDTEDLDLIGARKQLLSAQRTQAEHSGQHGQGHFPMSSMAPQLDHSQSHGHSHGHVQPYPTDGYLLFHQNDHQTVQPVGMGTNTFSQLQDLPGVGFLPPTGIGLNTESVNSDINEFDMDAVSEGGSYWGGFADEAVFAGDGTRLMLIGPGAIRHRTLYTRCTIGSPAFCAYITTTTRHTAANSKRLDSMDRQSVAPIREVQIPL